jgi:cell wall-associated NlpC family hydrolase
MIHTFEIEDLTIKTGDIICTMDGKSNILPGEFWRFVGRLVPGDVDHVAMYIGPKGRCVEASSRGVVLFDIPDSTWNTERMISQRGMVLDTFYGIVSPLEGQGFSEEEGSRMRNAVAKYCIAQVGKPYNLNFLNPETEEAFYCSQLIYKAYQQVGVNLNTGLSIEQLPGTNAIIYPQEIWGECIHRLSSQGKLAMVNDPS